MLFMRRIKPTQTKRNMAPCKCFKSSSLSYSYLLWIFIITMIKCKAIQQDHRSGTDIRDLMCHLFLPFPPTHPFVTPHTFHPHRYAADGIHATVSSNTYKFIDVFKLFPLFVPMFPKDPAVRQKGDECVDLKHNKIIEIKCGLHKRVWKVPK